MVETFAKLKTKAKKIKQDIFVLVQAYKHPRVSLYIKILSIIIVAYAFSPIDLIPDFIPVLGYLDDVILIPLGISLVIKLIPNNILVECREKLNDTNKVKHSNWVAGGIIILIWIMILFWIVKLFI